MAFPEQEALAILQAELGGLYREDHARSVLLGIGDDCALLGSSSDELVWSVDASFEGAHFLSDWMSPADIAHKSFHAALSDVPAMGARGSAVLCQLALTSRVSEAWLRSFARAQRELSQLTGVPIVGGNITWGASLGVVMTVLGRLTPGTGLLRSGARAGEEIWLLGEIGLASGGLGLLQRGVRRANELADRNAAARCLLAFRRPEAQLLAGPQLVGRASACMDISDGLVRDGERLAAASGVRLAFERDALNDAISPELRTVAAYLERSALELALNGGEDYGLLATGPAHLRPSRAKVLGLVEPGEGVVERAPGACRRLHGGFQHGE